MHIIQTHVILTTGSSDAVRPTWMVSQGILWGQGSCSLAPAPPAERVYFFRSLMTSSLPLPWVLGHSSLSFKKANVNLGRFSSPLFTLQNLIAQHLWNSRFVGISTKHGFLSHLSRGCKETRRTSLWYVFFWDGSKISSQVAKDIFSATAAS